MITQTGVKNLMIASPSEVLAQELGTYDARLAMETLRDAGYIIVRHDAIRLAQLHARDEAANDNVRPAKTLAPK